MDVAAFRASLLEWYRIHHRDLPWRRTSDPYAILVSEVMCQQTRVEVVVPYFERWMAAFPNLESLAVASEEEVFAHWSGLGYYRRASNLQNAAKHIANHGWPEDLQELPGVGPYIAGAVSSIAYGRPQVAIDGNVQRVLSRVGDIQQDVTKGEGKRVIQTLAELCLASEHAGNWTQALMELGARICTPKNPQCGSCPVSNQCLADEPESLPIKAAKPRPIEQDMHFARITDGSKILLVKRPKGALLADTWGLPGGSAADSLNVLVQNQTGAKTNLGAAAGRATHTFSHRKWAMAIHNGTMMESSKLGPNTQWVPMDSLQEWGISTAMRKAIAAGPTPQAH